MRGCIRKRYKGTYSVVIDTHDPATGKRKRKWVTVKGNRKDAETKRTELLRQLDTDTYVDTSKMTLGEWLTEWFDVAKTALRPGTVDRYQSILDRRLTTAAVGKMPLQKLRPSHLEAYYAAQTVSGSTLSLDHAILHSALAKAVRDGLVATNVAGSLGKSKPRAQGNKSDEARKHAWSAREAAAFLDAAKATGAQSAAFYATALDTGMRKGELGGVRWANVDLDAGKVRVVEQLHKTGAAPEWGPTKTGKPRTIDIDRDTVVLLREHKRVQAELKMRNRASYADHGLVFAKEWTDVRRRGETLGQPLQLNNLGQREYARLIKVATVRRIKFHGLRHTCATLLLQAGTPVHVVSERLGHSKVAMTMEVYAHVLPGDQAEAAATLGALLHR
jgi:integrase